MLNFQGNIVKNTKKVRILISVVEEDDIMVAKSHVNTIETSLIDECLLKTDISRLCNLDYEIKEVIVFIDTTTFADLLEDRATCSPFEIGVGSTYVHTDNYMFDESAL